MDSKFSRTKEVLSQKLEFPRDIILDIPKITIIGDNEISIENHKGILLFDEKEVKIKTNLGSISIIGSKFEILFMVGETLTISGKFKTVVYERNV